MAEPMLFPSNSKKWNVLDVRLCMDDIAHCCDGGFGPPPPIAVAVGCLCGDWTGLKCARTAGWVGLGWARSCRGFGLVITYLAP
eukprot:scaffold670665_cov59-Attheya_sp.AAC.1